MKAPLIEELYLNKLNKKLLNISNKDLNEIIETGLYYIAYPTCTNTPPQSTNGYLVVIEYSDKFCWQIYTPYNSNIKFERKNINGTWKEWSILETQNITTGVEFETGRIIDGKKEYGKRIDIGALPNATSKSVQHGVDLIHCNFIKQENVFRNADGCRLSFENYGINPTDKSSIIAYCGGTTIQFVTSGDLSGFTGHSTLYYTKN